MLYVRTPKCNKDAGNWVFFRSVCASLRPLFPRGDQRTFIFLIVKDIKHSQHHTVINSLCTRECTQSLGQAAYWLLLHECVYPSRVFIFFSAFLRPVEVMTLSVRQTHISSAQAHLGLCTNTHACLGLPSPKSHSHTRNRRFVNMHSFFKSFIPLGSCCLILYVLCLLPLT